MESLHLKCDDLQHVMAILFYLLSHTHTLHLADAFIQSDLQMRTIETKKQQHASAITSLG